MLDTHQNPEYGYAGFWKRFAACVIDQIILFIASFCVGLVVGLVYGVVFQPPKGAWLLGNVIGIIMTWLYFAWLESSPKQATPGKMMFGIKVTDMNGNRISFGNASGRHFGKILSCLMLFVGYIMAAFTPKKQGLHDIFAGCLVVNTKNTSAGMTIVVVIIAALGMMLPILGIASAALFPALIEATRRANMHAMASRAKDIYIAIAGANAEREVLPLGTVWPRSGKKMEAAWEIDIDEMTFENSSDYFTVLLDGENMGSRDWAPFVNGLDYSKLAGAGVPVSGRGRLKAENNAWTIAANILEETPDLIPVIVSRNVDPASLIPRAGDLCQQLVRPSKEFTTPFGNKGFVLLRRGGGILTLNWKHANLHVIYGHASEKELQKIREAFQEIEYLTP